MKKQVGIWIRVSTEDQAKGESPEHHEARARMYAKVKDWEVLEIYHLEAVSGKAVLHHPEAERMMRDVKSGKISGLIFSKIARLARNTKELLHIADTFREYNTDLISLHESIDTSSPAGRFFYTLISAMAQWEREEISERVAASVPIRAKLGKSLGGQAPYGYEWIDKKLVINEGEATVRRLIYDLFLQHKRKKTVANILNERGYRTRKNAKFSDTTLKRFLEDPIAKGIRRVNYTKSTGDKKHWQLKNKDEWVFNEAPAIISEETWEKVNTILSEQSKNRKQPLNRKTHLFTGFATCACSSKMYMPSSSPKYICYSCKNKIPQEDLEHIFHEQLTNYVITEENVKHYLQTSDNIITENKKRVSTLKSKAKKIQSKLDNLIELHSIGEIPTEGFKHHHNPLFEQLQQINNQIPIIEGETLALIQSQESGKHLFKEAQNLYRNWNSFTRDEKREIIESITDSIVIDTEDITINLKHLIPPTSLLNQTDGQRNLMDS
jgi:site-specific DNA recombinase